MNKNSFERLEHYVMALPCFSIQGADLVIYRDHKEIFRCMTGYMDERKEKPISKDTLYWIYSSSKVITCCAILQLIEKGVLSLNDEVYRYLPEFECMFVQLENGSLVPADKKITIFHLLTMTAGLTYKVDTDEIKALMESGQATTQNVIREIAKLPLKFHPGESFQYSMCHDVLGAVIEVVSGQHLSEYMTENIFEPLGMKRAYYHTTKENAPYIADFLRFNSDTLRVYKSDTIPIAKLCEPYESGGAGVLCAVDDYILFADALACGGVGKTGKRILMEESIHLMNQNHLTESQLVAYRGGGNGGHSGYGYGLGVRVLMDAKQVPTLCEAHEFGWGGACGTYGLSDPDNHLSIFFGMQMCPHIEFTYLTHPHNMIRDIVYGILYEDEGSK